jgi:enamine deaminase RidA (YjgF/YER057c/UK114 family)
MPEKATNGAGALERLTELGLELPEPPAPAGAYTRAVRTGNLVFVAGQLPLTGGVMAHTGPVGDAGETLEAGYAAARLCALNALGVLAAEGHDLNTVRIVRMTGFVCSLPGFTGQAQVVNGASELMAAVLGDAGVHARVAVGVNSLPLDATVELEVIAEVA